MTLADNKLDEHLFAAFSPLFQYLFDYVQLITFCRTKKILLNVPNMRQCCRVSEKKIIIMNIRNSHTAYFIQGI